jgi:ABC-2 type transport system ATP-binding protein
MTIESRSVGLAPETSLPESQARLVLQGVAKRWGKNDPLFDGVELELSPGMLALVEGRNGAGKTTLLRIAAGMITPDEGVVQLAGLSPRRNRREYQRQIGFLSAGSSGLYGRLTAFQHLVYWARLSLLPADERGSRIEAAIARFELEGIAHRRANRLSMGQRQRLTLALTFLHRPSLILLDEPWNSLDGQGIELVNAVVTEFIANGGTGVICVPTGHELDLTYAHVSYALADGRLERTA